MQSGSGYRKWRLGSPERSPASSKDPKIQRSHSLSPFQDIMDKTRDKGSATRVRLWEVQGLDWTGLAFSLRESAEWTFVVPAI